MVRYRLALAAIAAAAGTLYAWRLGANGLHPYYAPAVKSMSVSWKAFLYGGYDPAASITLDKLPGAFMVQALSARVFGFHAWSVLLPQVVATVLTVLVLYRVVNRWQGPVAGLAAACLYALTPAVAALARAEISDAILVLLLVLAADAWQRAVLTARTASLVWCGVWVGLAFQAKMVQAWGVLPAFALVYLVSAPATWWRRLAQVGVAGVVMGAVSLWWVMMVALTPASSRPYIDGSQDNSVWSMVFGYNLFDRYGEGEPVWWYLLGDGTAPQVGWLYPVALVGLVCGVWWRGRELRTDPVRAGFLMWGLWLLAHAVALSTGRVAHVFYVVAIAPAVVALTVGGLAALWKAYVAGESWRRWVLPATIAATAAWAVYLSLRFPDFLPWMVPAVAGVGTVAALGLVLAALLSRHGREEPTLWARASDEAVSRRGMPAIAGRRPEGDVAVGSRSGSDEEAVPRQGMPAIAGRRPGIGAVAARRWGADAIAGRQLRIAAAVAGVVAMMLAPAVWALSTVDPRHAGTAIGPSAGVGGDAAAVAAGAIGPAALGPGAPAGTPAGPVRVRLLGAGRAPAPGAAGIADHTGPRGQLLLDYLTAQHHGEKYVLATQAGESVSDLLLSGKSILPMGGFGGRAPFPTTDQLADMVADGRLRFVLLAAARPDAVRWSAWLAAHCRTVEASLYGGQQRAELLYDCVPSQ